MSESDGPDFDKIDLNKSDTTADDTAGNADSNAGPTADAVRTQSWPAGGPAELELTIDIGSVTVALSDTAEVRVEIRHDPSAGNTWTQGLTGLFSWLGSATAGPGGVRATPEDTATEAVDAAEVSWSETVRRLVVRSSQELPLRLVPLAVTVSAPTGSRIAVRAGSGNVRVAGRAGWTAVKTGSGEVTLEQIDGDLDLTTGSGGIDAGPVSGRARVRTGSGRICLAALSGPGEVRTGSGAVRLGEVRADVGVRTGSGDITVADAVAGRIDMTTGSGELRVGVHAGVSAAVDLSSGSGRARSDLDVGQVAPDLAPVLHVRGRAGSGDVLVTRAATAGV